jgi:hypothetical protein
MKDYAMKNIHIPKEEQKQHLIDIMRRDEELGLYEEPELEKAAEEEASSFYEKERLQNFSKYKQVFIKGAKWQQERMYSEEDMQEYAEFCIRCYEKGLPCIVAKDWLEQFKKK